MIRCFHAVVACWLLAAVAGAASTPATIDLRVERAPLFTLIERIARQCDAGLSIDASLQETMEREVTLNAKDAPWREAVALLESEYRITLSVVADRLVVVDADAAFATKLVRRSYDVRVLTLGIESYPGPDLDIPEPGGQGAKLLPPIEAEMRPESLEIIDAITRHVRPASWTRGGVSITQADGAVVITHLPEVQDEVLAFLQQLERTAARQVVCRIYRLAHVAAVTAPVVDAAAWKTLEKDAGAPIGALVMLDAQQNHHFCGSQTSFVADADVVQGIYDPIVTVVSRGLSVDVEPHETIDGVIVTTRFAASVEQEWMVSSVVDLAGRSLVALPTPSTGVDKSLDSRLVPHGGAALLRFGDRAYALAFEVVDLPGAAAKPAK